VWHVSRNIKSPMIVLLQKSEGSSFSGAVHSVPWCVVTSHYPRRTSPSRSAVWAGERCHKIKILASYAPVSTRAQTIKITLQQSKSNYSTSTTRLRVINKFNVAAKNKLIVNVSSTSWPCNVSNETLCTRAIHVPLCGHAAAENKLWFLV
jgi:hypothetical protein